MSAAAFRNHLNYFRVYFLQSHQIQTPIPFLENHPQNKYWGNTNELVTRCENRAVSAWSPTDRAQIFAVSTSHLQHKYNFHASVRSANLGKLQWASKERSDELTWQEELLLINLLGIWSIKVYFSVVHDRGDRFWDLQQHVVCVSAQMHICSVKENPHCTEQTKWAQPHGEMDLELHLEAVIYI